MKGKILFNRTGIIVGGFTALLGLIVLVGWHAHVPRLIQVFPGFVAMQYNTALCFLLSGISLLLIQNKLIKGGNIAMLVVGLIGFLTLLEYLLNINIGIDEMFMKHYITIETSTPGRMAPNTALCFLLSSLVVFLSSKDIKNIQIGGVLGTGVFGLSLVAFIGYIIGIEVTYGWGQLTQMAIHTAFGFMILAVGLTTLCWQKEYEMVLTKMKKRPRWLLGYAGSIAIFIFFIDLSTPLSASIGVLYIVLVLFGWFIDNIKITFIFAALSTLLIFLGFLGSPGEADFWVVVTNRSLAILSIWVTAFLLFIIKKREQKMARINIELRAKNKELEQIAFIASHDLKEPMNTVTSLVGMLMEEHGGKLDGNGNKYLEYIHKASERMSALIRSLLDYNLVGRNRRLSEIDCNVLVNDVKSDMRNLLNESKTIIQTSQLPHVKGYESELRMLFQNLISNAVKYRKENENPKINISCRRLGDFWQFSVADNGIGIEPEYTEKIFLIFRRLHLRTEYEGTGIGLAHCQKIVNLHGGKIWAESVLGKGSTFHFTIPA